MTMTALLTGLMLSAKVPNKIPDRHTWNRKYLPRVFGLIEYIIIQRLTAK